MARGENIFKRKDGRWEARYIKGYDENNKIRYGFCYGHSYREAKDKVSVAKASIVVQKTYAGAASTQQFEEVCRRWIENNKKDWKQSTLSKYLSVLERYLIPRFGPVPAKDIRSAAITDFGCELSGQYHLAPKTIRDILTILHKILTDFYREQDMTSTVRIVYPKTDIRELRILSKEEQQRLMKYLSDAPDIYQCCVLLALSTGLRLGELCALRWNDICMDTHTLYVRHTFQRVRNPDPHAASKTILQLGAPKTATSVRVVPLTSGISSLLQRYKAEDPQAFLITGSQKYPEPRTLQRRLKRYAEELHIEEIHFHTLRHTFATRCVEVGCDIKTLSEILGHASISMTLNRYVHPSLELKRENIRKLEQAGFCCAVS